MAPAERDVRVLVVSHVSSLWGAQLQLLDVALPLAERGVRLTLAAPPGPFLERWRDAGLGTLPLALPQHRGIRRPEGGGRADVPHAAREAGVVLWSTAAVARVARPFDIVQSHSLWAHLEVAVAGRMVRRPTVLDLHDIVEPGFGRRVLRLAARLADVVIANSDATAETVGGPSEHVPVVHPCVDLSRFAPGPIDAELRAELSARPDAPLVGILGRIDPNKNVGNVVEAVARLEGPAARTCLVVVGGAGIGTTDYVDDLRRSAEQRLGDRVRFLPPRDDVPDVLRCIDVLVNASKHEPFGRTILEAQASGVAVVGTAAGGVPEFVIDGVTGLLVPPGDVPALTDALQRLVTDPPLRSAMAAKAAPEARDRFNVERQADVTAAIYRHVAEA